MRISPSFLLAALIACAALPAAMAQQPAAEPSPGAPDSADAPARTITPAMQQKVRRFLDRFVDPDKSGAEMASLFAEDAQYYDRGAVGRKEIAREVERYSRHWPYRDFRVVEISYMNADPQSDGVFVAYTIEFEVANSARAITGRANYAALIGDLERAPKILAIRERVTQRRAGGAAPAEPGTSAASVSPTASDREPENAGSSGATAGGAGGGDRQDRGILPWPLSP